MNLQTTLTDLMKQWTLIFKCKDLRAGRLKELTVQPLYQISSIHPVSGRKNWMVLKNLMQHLVWSNRWKEEQIQNQAENNHLMTMLFLIGLKKRYTPIWYCQMIKYHPPYLEAQRVHKEKWSPVRFPSSTQRKWNLKRVLWKHRWTIVETIKILQQRIPQGRL